MITLLLLMLFLGVGFGVFYPIALIVHERRNGNKKGIKEILREEL